MTAHLLVLLSLADPTTRPDIATLPLAASMQVAPWSADDLRAECRAVVVRTLRVETFQPDRDVPELVMFRAGAIQTPAWGRSEKIQTIRRIDYCLEQALAQLQRREARLRKLGDAERSARGQALPARLPALAGGSGEARQVQQLISLIEATIQPETWAANGGQGVIQYWPPGYALVVRNTQAAHYELGQLLRILESRR